MQTLTCLRSFLLGCLGLLDCLDSVLYLLVGTLDYLLSFLLGLVENVFLELLDLLKFLLIFVCYVLEGLVSVLDTLEFLVQGLSVAGDLAEVALCLQTPLLHVTLHPLLYSPEVPSCGQVRKQKNCPAVPSPA